MDANATTIRLPQQQLRQAWDTNALWDELLTCQVALTLPLELPYLFRSREWMTAPDVLDLGCGNGAHLSALSRLFPEKTFTGVDVSEDMIAFARRKQTSRLTFAIRDLFDVTPGHSFLMARLVAQHLRSVEQFVEHFSRLLDPGGLFLSVEPDDSSRLFVPSLPAIEALYQRFIRHQKSSGYDRAAGFRICELAPAFGLRVVESTRVVVPSTLPGHKKRFELFHHCIFKLFLTVFELQDDYARLVDAWSEWASARSSYTQLGIHLALLRKVDA